MTWLLTVTGFHSNRTHFLAREFFRNFRKIVTEQRWKDLKTLSYGFVGINPRSMKANNAFFIATILFTHGCRVNGCHCRSTQNCQCAP